MGSGAAGLAADAADPARVVAAAAGGAVAAAGFASVALGFDFGTVGPAAVGCCPAADGADEVLAASDGRGCVAPAAIEANPSKEPPSLAGFEPGPLLGFFDSR